jgi:hypothetical protein
MRRYYVVFLLLSIFATPVQADVIYTPTMGASCRDYSKPQFGHWVCPGPGGYAVGFSDEGNMAGVAIGLRSSAPYKLKNVSQFRGAKKVFGDKLEWHVVNGLPKSAVLRVWKRADSGEADSEREVQQLEVYAIDGGKPCLFSTVDAAQPGANAKAAAFAEQATHARCVNQ